MASNQPIVPKAPATSGPVDPASINWESLGFSFMQTRCYVRRVWRDGKWGEAELLTGEYIPMHLCNTGIHYGQSCFEGLKAFRCVDGKIRLFRPDLNAVRLGDSAQRSGMPPVPEATFLHDVELAVRENADYVPPRGTGGSLYVRPLLFGSGCEIGVAPAPEFTFLVFVMPVGDYYKGGVKAVPALITSGFDRAAPLGVGSAKMAGNYAPCLPSMYDAKKRGFPITLFLDPKMHSYIEEFATANFIALIKHPPGSSAPYTFVTPDSPSILPSVTRRSLCDLAKHCLGWNVQCRPVAYDEVREGIFSEVAACGTAVVITPVNRIVREVYEHGVRKEEEVRIGEEFGDSLGPGFRQLYDLARAVQSGEKEYQSSWLWPTNGVSLP
ncbi:branched-chain amino acid aminotransferase [Syncephalis fuscata]|nr:branched-chain amino acid aminotransferase [Syncephalis fuscata]